MSFSKSVKEELIKHISPARHCQIAELSALLHYTGGFRITEKGFELNTDNDLIVRKCFTLLRKTFNIDKDSVEIDISVLKALDSDVLLQQSCCMRAYLRGAFLAVGTVSDPEKSYHLEYSCQKAEDADKITELLENFDINTRAFKRKNSYVVYIKDGSQIADVLNVLDAHVAMMEFENMRILKEMRNSVNRKVNCDTANINKTVSAAQKQIDEIKILMNSREYDELPDQLKEIAALRIEYPEVSLTELGEFCNPKIGKSGVNHRLRKLSQLAQLVKGGEL